MKIMKTVTGLPPILKATLSSMALHMLLTTTYTLLIVKQESFDIPQLRFVLFMIILAVSILLFIVTGILVVQADLTKVDTEVISEKSGVLTAPMWLALLYGALLAVAFNEFFAESYVPQILAPWQLVVFVPTLIGLIVQCFKCVLLVRVVLQNPQAIVSPRHHLK